MMIFDRCAMIQALKKSEATPEQQRDAVCMLLLLHQFDRKAMLLALRGGDATPEHQHDAAGMLLLLHQRSPANWDDAEGIYLTLKGSSLAGEYTPRGE